MFRLFLSENNAITIGQPFLQCICAAHALHLDQKIKIMQLIVAILFIPQPVCNSTEQRIHISWTYSGSKKHFVIMASDGKIKINIFLC